jgi:hypothetical protein
MNQTEQILLQAIQKSLWNTDIPFPEDTDWNAVLKEAEDQAVLGIVIGVAPVETQKEWRGRASVGTAHFVRILHYQEQLYKLFKENDIPMVILKGTAAAINYPNPSQRSMGDIDYLVPPEHFSRAKELLVQNGYTIEDDPRAPRHMHVYKDNVSFEQHRYFSSEEVDIEEFVTDGIQQIESQILYGNEFPMLPKLANGLVLLGHVVQHLKSGLGLRQVVDWMMYVDRELDDRFWNQAFEAAAKDVGLDTVAIVITRMCQIYLGLTKDIRWCKEADEKLCLELMDNLLSSGNFDRKRGKGSSVERVTSSIKRKGLFRYLQIAGEYNWESYHKHRWLKPFAWIYQIGRYAKQGFQVKRSGSQLREDIERGKRRIELFEKLKIGQTNE